MKERQKQRQDLARKLACIDKAKFRQTRGPLGED
jgi:hypothetical protein